MTASRNKVQVPRPRHGKAPVRRELRVEELCEWVQISPLVRHSYVLSRLWAWLSRVRLSPNVQVPVPRSLSRRDP